MAHLVEQMAFVGEKPWWYSHCPERGFELEDGKDVDKFRIAAGAGWKVLEWPDIAVDPKTKEFYPVQGQKKLMRSDTFTHLATVSKGYNVVQPETIFEFYRDLVDSQGFELETAGVLDEGRKIWCLANTGNNVAFGEDKINGYLLLATSFDRTMATRCSFTSVRVVCNNTLQASLRGMSQDTKGRDWLSIGHNAVFQPESVKESLGIGDGVWQRFSKDVESLVNFNVSDADAKELITQIMVNDSKAEAADHLYKPTVSQVWSLFKNGTGQNLEAANGTAWGLVNAVTEFVDHRQGARDASKRLNNAWFGNGSKIKARAFDTMVALAA